MYKVMLADDEKLILNGIKQIIEWEKLGLEVVAMATNGEEALELFKENPVDIVITDINMPKLDGLSLLKEIRALNKCVKFIILSGHDEFSYAKRAIELEVEGYILKPIDEEELEETLIGATNKLKAIDDHRMELISRHSKMLKFIEEPLTSEEIKEYESLLNINFKANKYSVSSLTLSKQYIVKDTVAQVMQVIQNQNMQDYPGNNQLEIFYNMKDAIILINSWNEENEDTIKAYYKAIQNRVVEVTGAETFLTIGACMSTINSIQKAYRMVKQFQKYVVIKGYGSFVDTTDQMATSSNNIMIDTTRLHKFMIESDRAGAIGYLEQIFDAVKKEGTSLENIYQIAIRLAIVLQEMIDDFKLDKVNSIKGLNEVIEEIYSSSDFVILKNIFIEEVSGIIDLISDTEVKYTPVVQQVVAYINENYWEDMNLKTLAYKYNINTSYLGQIFLKEVGDSFSQYLNNIKNSKAKELILNTNMKINDIAKAVGYPDTSYFYRKFKKHYGVSPATLREMKKY